MNTVSLSNPAVRPRPAAAVAIQAFWALVSYVAGLVLCLLFVNRHVPGLRLAVALLLTIAGFAFFTLRLSRWSVLPRLMILLYVLPFTTLIGYWFEDDYYWWPTPETMALMSDKALQADMVAIGLVGLFGLLCGTAIAGLRRSPARRDAERHQRSLGWMSFSGLLAAGYGLSWLSAPRSTIFRAAYGAEGTAAVAGALNFNVAYLLSYLILVLLYLDAERDPRHSRWKRLAVWTVTAVIVLYLQLLRGDRESFGLLAALAALELTSFTRSRAMSAVRLRAWRRRIRRFAVFGVAVVAVYLSLAAFRHRLDPVARGELNVKETLLRSVNGDTWTAVLLTNLGMASQYHAPSFDYLWGQTYVDYLKSLPPGFLTRRFGIERPLESWRGPTWWFVGISAGGIHISLVPFKNFGIGGVFAALTLIGYFIGRVDMREETGNFFARFFYAGLITTSFFWFWYGDMYIVRALMVVAALFVAYKTWLYFTGNKAGALPSLDPARA